MSLEQADGVPSAQQHAELFDQHYQQWGYCRDIYEYIDKRTDNKVIALYHHDNIKGTIVDNLLVKNRVTSVLDIGCGYGFFLQKLQTRYPDTQLDMYGVDISRVMVENAKRNIPDGHFYLSPAERLPFDNDLFQNVVCSEVIEHVIDPPQVIRELKRVTVPGGVVIISTPNYAGYTYAILRFVEKCKGIPFLDRLRKYLFKHTDFSVRNEEIPLSHLTDWVTKVGLELTKVVYLAPFAEQKLLLPKHDTFWRIMVSATRFLERVPLLNRIACNQLVLVTRKL